MVSKFTNAEIQKQSASDDATTQVKSVQLSQKCYQRAALN
jgi:hypothetical protein